MLGDGSGHHDRSQAGVDDIDQNRFFVGDEFACEGNDDPVEVKAEYVSDIGETSSQ